MISKQCFAILPQIREVDEFLQSEVGWRNKIFEVHPEVVFAGWKDGILTHGKRTGTGQCERELLIARGFGAISQGTNPRYAGGRPSSSTQSGLEPK